MPDDTYTNEFAAMWGFKHELAEAAGIKPNQAGGFIKMLHKRVGAKRAYKGLRAALEKGLTGQRVKSYAIMAAKE